MHKQQILEQINGHSQLKEYLGELVAETRDLYKESKKTVMKMFQRPEAKDLLPTFRRAGFETKMYEVANQIGVEQSTVLNQARNSSHREIRIDNFLLVGNHVSSPNILVRDSNFRKTLAANSQLSFFDADFEQQDGHVFGVIMHGEIFNEREDISSPFLYLGFPNKDLTDYVLKVDLLEMFQNKSELDIDSGIVQIKDNVEPVFREKELVKEI